ncbi:MAG: DUF86 domain-containing protein [Thermodesulfovibrio sp.]|nr:DUF86 domain-containing protein [Thermodesulfovibrio sp.]
MKRKRSIYIKDMIEAIEKIEEYTAKMNLEDFKEDNKTSDAVVRRLTIIGEAVKQIPADVRERFKDIPWSSLAKTRDKTVHFYFGIDYETIWKIIREHLPPLIPELKKILEILIEEEK